MHSVLSVWTLDSDPKGMEFLRDVKIFATFVRDKPNRMRMNIARLIFNPFQENTYVLWDDSRECVVVDAGCYMPREENELTEFVRNKGLKPVMLVNTHGHVDHLLGVAAMKEEWNVPFALHGDDRFLVESARMHGALYGFEVKEIPQVEIDLKGRETLSFGNTVLRILHTPGHTPGHVCFFEPESKTLFSGDTLFRESIGRTDLPGGDYGWIMKSIVDRLLPLGDEVTFYPGHGPESTIGHEVLYNPFVTEVLNGDVKY